MKKTKPAEKTTKPATGDNQRSRVQRLDKMIVYTTDSILKSAGMTLSGSSASENQSNH
jgi:hypothetical protein